MSRNYGLMFYLAIINLLKVSFLKLLDQLEPNLVERFTGFKVYVFPSITIPPQKQEVWRFRKDFVLSVFVCGPFISTNVHDILTSPGPKSHVRYCYHFESIVVLLRLFVNFHIWILFSETTGHIGTKFGRNILWTVLYTKWMFLSKGNQPVIEKDIQMDQIGCFHI